MKKFIIVALTVLLAFAFTSCDPNITINNIMPEDDTPDSQNVTVSEGSNLKILDKLDYFTNIYYNIKIYEIEDNTLTYRETITDEAYKSMTLYTAPTYNSANGEEEPVADLDIKLVDGTYTKLYTECVDLKDSVNVIYAYKTNDGVVHNSTVTIPTALGTYKKYAERHVACVDQELSYLPASNVHSVRSLSIDGAAFWTPAEGDFVYESRYTVPIYILDNSTYTAYGRSMEAYMTESMKGTWTCSVATFAQQNYHIYAQKTYTDDAYPRTALEEYPQYCKKYFTNTRHERPTIIYNGVARTYGYAEALYSSLEYEWGTGDLYTQNTYDPDVESASKYKIDACETYIETGDVVYNYCNNVHEITVTVDGQKVTLLDNKTYKSQGYNKIYSSSNYVIDPPENLANTKPVEGDVVYTSTINVAMKVQVINNALTPEIISNIMVDGSKTFAENGYVGYYSQDSYDPFIESANCYLVDDDYPISHPFIYMICNPTT